MLPVHSLVIGMYVAELDIPWLDSPFLFQGFSIETEDELESLRNVCQFVYVDTSKQKKRKRKSENKIAVDIIDKMPPISAEPPVPLGTFEEEVTRAHKTYSDSALIVTDIMGKIVKDGEIDTALAKEAVSACVNSILHSPDASLWMTQLKNKDKYTAQHSLNVCVLSIVLGRHIGLSEMQLNQVGLCGMMHDMGKMLVPLDILNKPEKHTAEEVEIMKTHTTLGYELLKSSSNMFQGAIETALTHHEHLDGNGYPRKLKANQVSFYSNMVTIVDMYDAITSDRIYQKGRTHHEATKIMLDLSGSHLDSQLTVKFIESLGVYPPGCFVELSNGAIAIVIEENRKFKLRPKVLVILNEYKQPVDVEGVIDLSDLSENNLLSIKAIIRPVDFSINSEKYYQESIMQKGFSRQ